MPQASQSWAWGYHHQAARFTCPLLPALCQAQLPILPIGSRPKQDLGRAPTHPATIPRFLCLKNKSSASAVFTTYTQRHPSIEDGPPFVRPLLNFIWFLLLAVDG